MTWLHQPSDEGNARLEEEFEARHATFADITSAWNDDDVRTFTKLMRRFNERVEERRGQPWPRKNDDGAESSR